MKKRKSWRKLLRNVLYTFRSSKIFLVNEKAKTWREPLSNFFTLLPFVKKINLHIWKKEKVGGSFAEFFYIPFDFQKSFWWKKKQKLSGSPCRNFLHFSPSLKKLIFSCIWKKEKVCGSFCRISLYTFRFSKIVSVNEKAKTLRNLCRHFFIYLPIFKNLFVHEKRKSRRKPLSNFFTFLSFIIPFDKMVSLSEN